MKESKLQNEIVKWLESQGFWVMKCHQTGLGKKGRPDLIACCWGMMIGFEVKVPGGKATAMQADQMQQILMSGGLCRLVVSLDEVKEDLLAAAAAAAAAAGGAQ